jgi:GMP synthase-like glutamine amidotransferase
MSGRFVVIDCEDAPKWAGHERLWVDALAIEGDTWQVARAYAGELPNAQLDGVVITGSHYSVVDDPPVWLPPLLDLVARWTASGVRVVGACFGCQVIAQALGGTVRRNPSGRFDVGGFELAIDPMLHEHPWARPLGGRQQLRLLKSHGDSVTEPPPDATILARSDANPIELFAVGNTLAIQPHPELTPELVDTRILPSLIDKGRIVVDDLVAIRATMARLDAELTLEALRAFLHPDSDERCP